MDFNIKESLLNLVYPPLCAHCQSALDKKGPLFCAACLDQVSLNDAEGRCRTCFFPLQKGRCEKCMGRSVVIHRQVAACETMGPAKTLLNAIDHGMRECISPAASLMAYQWIKLQLPMPDFLIPLPTSFWQKQQHGFDAHLLLAQQVGKILSVPVKTVLERKFDRQRFFTQAELRFKIQVEEKGGAGLSDCKLLLVAPVLNDLLFREIGTELRSLFPAQVDALAFAMPFTE